MAGWLIPRSFATWAWFKLCLFISSDATMARTEGRAHLTATSQGVSKFRSPLLVYLYRYICFITNVISREKTNPQKNITPYCTVTQLMNQNKNPRPNPSITLNLHNQLIITHQVYEPRGELQIV